jgi:hypothetical protein
LITGINAFVTSFLRTGGKPAAGFVNFGKAKIHVATDAPLNTFSNRLIPSLS